MEGRIHRVRRVAAEWDEPEYTDLLDAAQALEINWLGARYMREYTPLRTYEEENANAQAVRRRSSTDYLTRRFWDGFAIGLYHGRFPNQNDQPAPTYTIGESAGQREHRVGYLLGYRRGRQLLRQTDAFWRLTKRR